MIALSLKDKISRTDNLLLLTHNLSEIPSGIISREESDYIIKKHKYAKQKLFIFNKLNKVIFIKLIDNISDKHVNSEMLRKTGNDLLKAFSEYNIKNITISCDKGKKGFAATLAEGIILGAYKFDKYKNDKEDNLLKSIAILKTCAGEKEISILRILCESVYKCRDLVNEPALEINATSLSGKISELGKEAGVKTEILSKKKIESLKMGGLLSVNKGSHNPPTFSIMEWKPSKPVNIKPVVLVGKGVTYDSGGMNLKSYSNMQDMKSDMSGAAVVASVIYAVALAKLPVHVVGLMPATDNMPGPGAIVPGDIITMSDGTTVEVLNTDAEGRLILADALLYASGYNPSVVIDIATLTGSAQAAIGNLGIAAMHNKAQQEFRQLVNAGLQCYERLAELPNWDEYKEMIKSETADIKNVGGKYAGAITAFKFLEHFTSYPFIHLDIAGPAFLETRNSYRGAGATGTGVRLLFNYFNNKTNKVI